MPSRPLESLGLWPRDPLGSGGHYFFSNNALAGILILVFISTKKLNKYDMRELNLPNLTIIGKQIEYVKH